MILVSLDTSWGRIKGVGSNSGDGGKGKAKEEVELSEEEMIAYGRNVIAVQVGADGQVNYPLPSLPMLNIFADHSTRSFRMSLLNHPIQT